MPRSGHPPPTNNRIGGRRKPPPDLAFLFTQCGSPREASRGTRSNAHIRDRDRGDRSQQYSCGVDSLSTPGRRQKVPFKLLALTRRELAAKVVIDQVVLSRGYLFKRLFVGETLCLKRDALWLGQHAQQVLRDEIPFSTHLCHILI
jgi:hypothetical protein